MKTLRWLALSLLLPLLAACAGSATRAPLSDEEQLQTRAVQRWTHLIAGEPVKAWDYLSPGYRSSRDRSEYVTAMSARPVTWLSAEYHSHSCEQERRFCEVNIKVTFKVLSRQLGVGEVQSYSFLTERWVKSGDTWFHVPEDVTG